jgi:NADPH:quinone reductase-like Zn-dependent oxidoreductase
MKAIAQDRYGSADVLELKDVAMPTVGDRDVLIRVRAAGVNALDWHVMRGSPKWARMMIGPRRPKVRFRGVDVAGQVEAVGKDVEQLRTGDEVFGWCQGAFAEYARAAENHFAVKPAALTFEQAAATPLAAMTALQGLRDVGGVQAGQSVLIVGASGGVGTFAVQIAKAFGAEVTGVCGTASVELVRSIGADHVVDYTREDFSRSTERYDVIFQLAGTASPSACRRVLQPKGTLVASSGAGVVIDRILKAAVLSPFVGQKLAWLTTVENEADLAVVKGFVEAGSVRPIIDRTYPLSQAAEAIRYVETGHTRGKTVVTM